MNAKGIPTSLYHHPAWVAWKETTGWKPLKTGLGFPVLVRRIQNIGTMAYAVPPNAEISEGSLAMSEDAGAILERLTQRILPFLPADCTFVRWDVMAGAWSDSRGRALEPRLQELRMNASTRWRGLRKSMLEHSCPDTMIVELRGGEASHKEGFDYRTKYSIRLAERRGTKVELLDEEGLGEFQEMYDLTSIRHRLPSQPRNYFPELFRMGKSMGLEVDLYLARFQGSAAAGAIFARLGDTAWYLFAASEAGMRSAAGPTAILSRALDDFSSRGVRRVDLLGVGPVGVDNHPLSGLTLFKSKAVFQSRGLGSGAPARRLCQAGTARLG
jgi:hypothetical protein